MSSRQKYKKVIFQNGDRVTAKNSLQGMVCISDYKQDANSRVLVFERPDKATATAEAAAPRTRKKKAVNGGDDSPSKSLAFPGEAAATA